MDYYLQTRLPNKVKLIRLDKRMGLIRARLSGARTAKGDVLVFLDAHCEVIVDWLDLQLNLQQPCLKYSINFSRKENCLKESTFHSSKE